MTCFGSLLAFAGILSVRGARNYPAALIVCVVAALAGMFFMFWATYQLRKGIRNERWAVEQVDTLRNVVQHSAWTATTLALFVSMVAAFLLDRHVHQGFFWASFLVLQAMTQLSVAVHAPSPRHEAANLMEWTEAQPLRSDHWGERER